MIDERKKIEPVSVEIKEKNEVSIVRNLTAQIMAVIEKTECTYWDAMKALDTLKEYYELKGTQFLDNASIQEVATYGVLPKQEAGKDCQEEGEKRKIEPVSVEIQGKDGVRTVCKLVSQIAAIIEKRECIYWDAMQALDALKKYYELKGAQLLDSVSIQEVATMKNSKEQAVEYIRRLVAGNLPKFEVTVNYLESKSTESEG